MTSLWLCFVDFVVSVVFLLLCVESATLPCARSGVSWYMGPGQGAVSVFSWAAPTHTRQPHRKSPPCPNSQPLQLPSRFWRSSLLQHASQVIYMAFLEGMNVAYVGHFHQFFGFPPSRMTSIQSSCQKSQRITKDSKQRTGHTYAPFQPCSIRLVAGDPKAVFLNSRGIRLARSRCN